MGSLINEVRPGRLLMHPIPQGYCKVEDGDLIRAGDLALGKVNSACSQSSYGWKNVDPHLIGQEFFEGASELGHPFLLIRKIEINTSELAPYR